MPYIENFVFSQNLHYFWQQILIQVHGATCFPDSGSAAVACATTAKAVAKAEAETD